jgi:SAM-dependent methyltransferase
VQPVPPEFRIFPPLRDPRIDFFDELAPRWDTAGQDPEETLAQLAAHADLLGLRPGENLLEVGCGTGQITGWLAQQVAPGRMVAVDFAAAMLQQARCKGVPAEFQCADACCDFLGQEVFDVVLCFHSFPHFRDQRSALANLVRALRAAGRLIVMHLAGSVQINAFHDHVGGAVAGDHLPARDEWDRWLPEVGLTLEEFHDREGLFLLTARRWESPGLKTAPLADSFPS